MSAIGLNIPADIVPVLGGNRICERQLPRSRSLEGDVDLIVSGKLKGEFNVAHVKPIYAAFTWSKSCQRAASSCVWIVLRVCSLSVR